MDFPFEYVERVFSYPSFDHHLVTKEALEIARTKNEIVEYPESEEDEMECDRDVDEKERELVHDILLLEIQVAKEEEEEKKKKKKEASKKQKGGPNEKNVESTTNDVNVASSCTSSDTLGDESLIDTSDTDSAIFKNEAEREEIARRKFKIMGECACTASECDSNPSSATISYSSDLTSSDEDDAGLSDKELRKGAKEEEVSPSSEESSSSSDEDIDLQEEIVALEGMLVEKKEGEKDGERSRGNKSKSVKKEEKEKEGDDDDDDDDDDSMTSSPDSDDVLESFSSEKSSDNPSEERSKSKNEKSVLAKENVKSPSKKAEVSSGSTSSSSSSSSPSESSHFETSSDSCVISSSQSDEDDDNSEDNLERFMWDSDDIYATTDTDSELEGVLDFLDRAMTIVNGIFGNTEETEKMTDVERQKYITFAAPLPIELKTQKRYEMMEEAEDVQDKETILKNFWLVQQIDTGHMYSAKLASRKNPEHIEIIKNLDKERKLLFGLLPELAEPTHIARIADVGFDADFKYLILEDLGTDLLSLFEEFGMYFNRATVFLITHFTFQAIRELHSFDILHLNIRPSSFSVTQNPFNIKITDYSKCLPRLKSMRVPDDLRPDSFSPRIFHQKGIEFDDLVDFEAWVFSMIHLCTNHGLPWFQDPQNMLQKKEAFFNDPLDFKWDGCCEAVPMAAAFIADHQVTYGQFLQKLNLVFSVEVMQYADDEQPLLWTFDELQNLRRRRASEAFEDVLLNDARHWNPADESDSEDGIDVEDKIGLIATGDVAKAKKKEREEATSSTGTGGPDTAPSSPASPSSSQPSSTSPRSGPASEVSDQMSSSGPEQMSYNEETSRNKQKLLIGKSSKSTEEPTSLGEQQSRPVDSEPEGDVSSEKRKEKEKEKNQEGKPFRRDVLDLKREELRGSPSSTGSSSCSSSFSSWTDSSSEDLDEKRKMKKATTATATTTTAPTPTTKAKGLAKSSDDRSIVDYYDDLDTCEMDDYKCFKELQRDQGREKSTISSDSDNDVISDEEGIMKKMNLKIWDKKVVPASVELKLKLEKWNKMFE